MNKFRNTLVIIIVFALLQSCAPSTSGKTKERLAVSASLQNVEIPARLKGGNEQILKRKAYTVSYNKETLCPNWVAWELTADEASGTLKRVGSKAFREDEDVPSPRATLADYRNAGGYNRGHMCPAGDNRWDSQAMYESFLFTNICPQDIKLNSGVWNDIEVTSRQWAKEYGAVYIVTGPIFYKDSKPKYIGPNKVRVPDAFFKVVLSKEENPKAIGFICKNVEGSRQKVQYVNTVDDVERITGMDFFPALPDKVENEVEASASLADW